MELGVGWDTAPVDMFLSSKIQALSVLKEGQEQYDFIVLVAQELRPVFPHSSIRIAHKSPIIIR